MNNSIIIWNVSRSSSKRARVSSRLKIGSRFMGSTPIEAVTRLFPHPSTQHHLEIVHAPAIEWPLRWSLPQPRSGGVHPIGESSRPSALAPIVRRTDPALRRDHRSADIDGHPA